MEDSQRQAMYDGWARGKKWTRVEVEMLDEGRTHSGVHGNTWKACAVDAPFGCVFRQSRIAAIQRIQGLLNDRGYEISNLAELFGIQEERRTFLGWLKEIELRRGQMEVGHWYEHKNDIPEHKLKDPSKFGTEPEYPSRRIRRILNDLDYNK